MPDLLIFKPTLKIRTAERLLTMVMRQTSRQYLSLKPYSANTLPPPQPGHTYTLYAHVPFCESLCPYCSFNRFRLNKLKAVAYFKTLHSEMRLLAALGYQFKSLYIGGGTPTILPDELANTIDLARQLFSVNEVSCETNPNHLTPKIIDLLKDRVQRLSVGVQSFDDTLLKQMNRFEKFGSGEEIFENIRKAAPFFHSLNVDMIFNFPNQTAEILQEDLRKVVASGAQQVTFYPLMTSPSVNKTMALTVGKPRSTREADYYSIIRQMLAPEFTPLSAWTFARNGSNLIDEYIVDSEEYAAVGSGVFSYLDGHLYSSTFSLSEYERRVSSGKMGVTGRQRFNQKLQMRYWMMVNMFGLNFNHRGFKQRFGTQRERGLWIEMLFFNLMGSFSRSDPDKPSPVGEYLSLVIMREFFTGVNRLRDIARVGLNPEDRGEQDEVENASQQS